MFLYGSLFKLALIIMSLDSFQQILAKALHQRGGGRRPQEQNQTAMDINPVIDHQPTYMRPSAPDESRLTIVQITDVYTLDNFASLKTMLHTIREAQGPNDEVVSMLTGDFLAPYLLSSIDHGQGMMMAINEAGIDYLTFGNHEADVPHKHVCQHIKNYTGTFINSNMQSHDAMDSCVPYEVIEVTSPDGQHTHRIGLVAVLSNDPKLYSHFKEPAFGGAAIEDPWETLAHYKTILEEEHGCDLVIPLEHMYVPENERTCNEFDFPLILSGHDHHRIDQMINNTRLIKPGMDGIYSGVVEIVFQKGNASPKIRSTFVETAQFKPCPLLKQKTDAAYDVLLPLRNTMLASVLPSFRPLSSKDARGSVTTMGKLICSILKQSLWQSPNNSNADAVILMGGNIRGNEEYPDDAFFSLETLEAEIKSDEVIGYVDMPGHVLAAGIEATHAGDPIPGWFQYDDGISQDAKTGRVLTVGRKPLEPKKIYRVATKIKDLTNGQSPPLAAYYKAHPELLPAKGQYINIHSELMAFFARGMFRKLWEATGELIPDPNSVADNATQPVNLDRLEGKLRLSVLDRDQDGYVTIDDIHCSLRDYLGLSVDDNYKTLAEHVHACADVTGNGKVTVEDFEVFCSTGMPRELKLQEPKWHEAFPDPLPELSQEQVEELRKDPQESTSSQGANSSTDHDSERFPGDGPSLKRHDTELTQLVDQAGPPPEITVHLVSN